MLRKIEYSIKEKKHLLTWSSLKWSSFWLFALTLFVSCSGATSRGAIGGLTYSPGGNGFSYKSVSVPGRDFSKWAKQNKGKIRKTIASLENGFVLEIVGHTDSSGPRRASGGRKGNVWYSTQRAKAVYNALAGQGISRRRIRYKGIADDEIIDSSDTRGQINRRVSFRIVKK